MTIPEPSTRRYAKINLECKLNYYTPQISVVIHNLDRDQAQYAAHACNEIYGGQFRASVSGGGDDSIFIADFDNGADIIKLINKIELDKGVRFEKPNQVRDLVSQEERKLLTKRLPTFNVEPLEKGFKITIGNLADHKQVTDIQDRLAAEGKLGARAINTFCNTGQKDRHEVITGFVNGDDVNTFYNELKRTIPFSEGPHVILGKINKAKTELAQKQQQVE